MYIFQNIIRNQRAFTSDSSMPCRQAVALSIWKVKDFSFQILAAFILSFSLLCLFNSQALSQTEKIYDKKSETLVLTAHPVTQFLTDYILKDTDIKSVMIQPEGLPLLRLSSFLNGRGKKTLSELAPKAEAVITIRSLWNEDPVYAFTRRYNIRIVEIDAGRPLDGELAGIALTDFDSTSASKLASELKLSSPVAIKGKQAAPWLSLNNLGAMADIIATDITKLEPDSREIIAANVNKLKRILLSIKASAEKDLARASSLSCISLSPHFNYLAADFGLDLVATLPLGNETLDEDQAANLVSYIKTEGIALVLMDQKPEEILKKNLQNAQINYIVLDNIDEKTGDVLETVKNNVEKLVNGFLQ